MSEVYKNCQSCGMPLKNSPNGGGSEKDGGISTMYCSYCYQNGEFTRPDFTVSQMQDLVKSKMKEMPFPLRLFSGIFVKKIPQLKRWSK